MECFVLTSTGSVQDRIQTYINAHPDYQGKHLSDISAELISAGVVSAEEIAMLDSTSTFSIAGSGMKDDVVDSFEHVEEESEAPILEGEKTVRKINPKTGEVTLETVTYFNGKPSEKRVTNESGELVAVYSYSKVKLVDGTDAVAIVRVGSDVDKIEQTIVTDVDDNGDYVDEAFVSRHVAVLKDAILSNGVDASAGSKCRVFVSDGNLVDVVSDGDNTNVVTTVYNGDSISEYDS